MQKKENVADYYFSKTYNLIFSYVLNKVFVAARKHNTKRNKSGFILYTCDSLHLKSRVKNKTGFEFLFYKIK